MANKRAEKSNRFKRFMFATGIECSYPVIKNGSFRRDELELTGHYERWREDLELVREMNIRFLRYGIPFYRINTAPDKFDFSFTDEVLTEMRRLKIEPILDLCHFGMPDWMGNSFQNGEFPEAFARYACAVATRYPWIKFYTPVNEIFICAKFSALNGYWNEQERSERAFITATKNLVKASVLAMKEILEIQPEAIFIQSESTERTHTVCNCTETQKRADWENQIRFLALDFLYCHEVRADIHEWLADNGVSEKEYQWFMSHGMHERCVMGNDYYKLNERILQHGDKPAYTGEVFGWYLVTHEYYTRYRKPVMHTETNQRADGDPVIWLWRQWQNLLYMREKGIPVLGFTWFSLIDQIDWDTELREVNNHVNPFGLYDLERKIRPVGEAYRQLIEEFGEMPVIPNGEFLTVI